MHDPRRGWPGLLVDAEVSPFLIVPLVGLAVLIVPLPPLLLAGYGPWFGTKLRYYAT